MMTPFVTTGKIATELRGEGLDVDRDQVCYAVRKLRLEPVGVAGPARVFPQSAVGAVRDFLASKRGKHQPQTTTA
jgi:hypothetical protein